MRSNAAGWERMAAAAAKRLGWGVMCVALAAAAMHPVEAPRAGQRWDARSVASDFEFVIPGAIAPAVAIDRWRARQVEASRRESAILSHPPSAFATQALDWVARVVAAAVALGCLERWGAFSEATRVLLIRIGFTSRAPAQRTSLGMKAARQFLAMGCAALAIIVSAIFFLHHF